MSLCRVMVFRCAVTNESKSTAKFFYERLLPYLSGMSIQSAINFDQNSLNDISDYRPVPKSGDVSFMNALVECVRVIGRKSDLSSANSKFVSLLLKYGFCKAVLNDMFCRQSINVSDKIVIDVALKSIAKEAGQIASGDAAGGTMKLLVDVSELISCTEKKMELVDDDRSTMPIFESSVAEEFPGCTELDMFGRFRREFCVEKLAGTAPPPPILRPVEMTLVPDKVTNFLELTKAMRDCVHLCVLLSNQRDFIVNSYTLRLCLIEHLFVRVIPLPLPLTHPDRATKCFWHAQPMRYETQADVMHLLNLLCRHFAAASLSIKMTRSGDAVRMLVFACMATVCDANMRKIAIDIPSQSSLHYSGEAKGPVKPFGFDIGTFAEESEYLKFTAVETATARTQVLDYFHQLKKFVPKENMILRFNESNECSSADKKFIDQICLQMTYIQKLDI